MNIWLHTRVLRRHWVILGMGFVVALVLAAMTAFTVSVSPLKVSWKVKPLYGVRSVLMVTQPGFPQGQAAIAPTNGGAATTQAPTYADPGRYDYLAGLYAQLATGDAVLKRVLGKGGFRDKLLYLGDGRTVGEYTAQQISAANQNGTLPFVQINATSESPAGALRIATRATDALVDYVRGQQSRFGITGKKRVELSRVEAPTDVEIVKGRGLVRPLAVLALCLLGAVGLAYLRENYKREALADEADTRVVGTAFARDPPGRRRSSGARGAARK